MLDSRRNQGKRIRSSLVVNLLGEMINKICPLVILAVAASRLGIVQFGQAQYAMAFLEALFPLIAFGYGTYAAIEIGKLQGAPASEADEGISKLLSGILGLRFLHFAAVAAVIAVMLASPAFAEKRLMFCAAGLLLIATCIESDFIHYGTQSTLIRSVFVSLSKLVCLGAIIVFVQDADDALLFTVLASLQALLIALASGVYHLRRYSLRRVNLVFLARLFRNSRPYSLYIFLMILGDRFDVFIVERLLGAEANGFYSGEMRLVQSLISAVGAISIVFYSEILSSQGKEELSRHAESSLRLILMLVAPVSVGVWFTDAGILSLIFSDAFVPHARAFSLLTCAGSLNAFIYVFGLQILVLKGDVNKFNLAYALAILTGIGLCFWLAADFGLEGAATAAIASKILAAVACIALARRHLVRLPWLAVLQTIVPAFGMGLGLWLLGRYWQPNLWFNLGAGALLYGLFFAACNPSQLKRWLRSA